MVNAVGGGIAVAAGELNGSAGDVVRKSSGSNVAFCAQRPRGFGAIELPMKLPC